MTSQEVIETQEKIKNWLVQEGLFKSADQPENLCFQIAAEFPAKSGRHLSVIQPKSHEDMIVVFSRIRLADAHQKALAALPPKERERLLWLMRYDLLFQDSSFEIEPGGGDLQSIRFTREIYYDGLTKNELMQAIRNNFKCELYVVWKFQEIFGDGPNSRVAGPPEPMYS
ncbi:MAG: hypothetical protein QG575_565 [Euryarchaeota archaeon]|nr:hypothetical protein [Euryarchaeota archaeon]